MTTCEKVSSALNHIEAILEKLEKKKKSDAESKIYVRSFADPERAFVRPDTWLKRIVYLVQQWLARKEGFSVGGTTYRVRPFDHDANVRVLRKLFHNALPEIVHGEKETAEKTQRVVEFVLRLDNMTESQPAKKTAHDMLSESIDGAASAAELELIFSSIALCGDDEKRFFSEKIFDKLNSSGFSESGHLSEQIQPFLSSHKVEVNADFVMINVPQLEDPVVTEDPVKWSAEEKIEISVEENPVSIPREVVAETPSLESNPPAEIQVERIEEKKPILVSQGTLTEPLPAERNPPSPSSPGRSISVLSGNTMNINIGGGASRCGQALVTAATVTLLSTCGLPISAASVVGSLVAPQLMQGGRFLLSKVWTPIRFYVDAGCDKLPRYLKTPMKAVWRITLVAGAAFCVYKSATGWTVAAPAKTEPVVAATPPPAEAASPVGEGGWLAWGHQLWREGRASFHRGEATPVGETLVGKAAQTALAASAGGLLLQEAAPLAGGIAKREFVEQLVFSNVRGK